MRINWFSYIRVTGLFLVLIYHFFPSILPGGFIGVDVFFTFSGYLITALLIDEYSRNKKIDLLGFYKRLNSSGKEKALSYIEGLNDGLSSYHK